MNARKELKNPPAGFRHRAFSIPQNSGELDRMEDVE